jgi:3-oxoadipate enol-lactonase
VLSHALGCDLTMWDSMANRLAACRVNAYDHRGHGSSDAPAGPYAMADLADDAARLLCELNQEQMRGPVVWIGLSMGGMVGRELALGHPSLVGALVLAHTTSGSGCGTRLTPANGQSTQRSIAWVYTESSPSDLQSVRT